MVSFIYAEFTNNKHLILSFVILSVVILSVFILNVVILSVVVLNVVAPWTNDGIQFLH
jgi:hypothetical protein